MRGVDSAKRSHVTRMLLLCDFDCLQVRKKKGPKKLAKLSPKQAKAFRKGIKLDLHGLAEELHDMYDGDIALVNGHLQKMRKEAMKMPAITQPTESEPTEPAITQEPTDDAETEEHDATDVVPSADMVPSLVETAEGVCAILEYHGYSPLGARMGSTAQGCVL